MVNEPVLILTGAGRGIGRGVALELADADASVVVNDLGTSLNGEDESPDPAVSTVKTIESEGGDAISHVGDVTDPSYTKTLIADTVDTYGRVDGIANFAGIIDRAPIHEMSFEQWERVLNVHLGGHFALLRSATRHWISTDFDRQRSFLCISSQAALGHATMANYATAKAGILGLMRTAANELAEHNVRVNALFPSATTRMSKGLSDHPFGEELSPEQVAPMVGYLMSEAATDVTGCTLRAGGEEIGFVNDPEMERLGYRDGGWSIEAIAETFPSSITAGIDLERSGTLVSDKYDL